VADALAAVEVGVVVVDVGVDFQFHAKHISEIEL
jgi:hypothetical protein